MGMVGLPRTAPRRWRCSQQCRPGEQQRGGGWGATPEPRTLHGLPHQDHADSAGDHLAVSTSILPIELRRPYAAIIRGVFGGRATPRSDGKAVVRSGTTFWAPTTRMTRPAPRRSDRAGSRRWRRSRRDHPRTRRARWPGRSPARLKACGSRAPGWPCPWLGSSGGWHEPAALLDLGGHADLLQRHRGPLAHLRALREHTEGEVACVVRAIDYVYVEAGRPERARCRVDRRRTRRLRKGLVGQRGLDGPFVHHGRSELRAAMAGARGLRLRDGPGELPATTW